MQIYDKYLVLEFNSAKLFRNHKATKDRCFNIFDGGDISRLSTPKQFKEPITMYQISNMLHVLFNERPAPTFRKSIQKRLDWIDDLANSSFLNIDSIKIHNNKKDTWIYPKESILIKKAVPDAWNPSVSIDWFIIKRYTSEHYDWFINEVNNILSMNSCISIPYKVVNSMLMESDKGILETFFIELKNRGLSGIRYYILDDSKTCEITKKYNKTAITVINGIDKVIKLKGEIFVPINDEYLSKLREGKGVATLLDGGTVVIKKVIPTHLFEYDQDKHILIKTISTELE
jgi:hypothetical protein